MTGKKNRFDERQQNIINKAMALSGVVGFLYGILMILYKFIKSGSFISSFFEVALILSMLIITIIFYIGSGQGHSSTDKNKTKIKLSNKLDERERKRIRVALGMGGLMAFVYSFIIIIFTLISTKKLESAYSQIGLIVLMGVIIFIYNIRNHEYIVPTTFLGKVLPLGDTKEDKRSRIIHYIKDAVRLGFVFLVLDILNPKRVIVPIPVINSKILSYGFNSFLSISIFFIMNYLWGEYNVKKKRRFDESLEEDDENE